MKEWRVDATPTQNYLGTYIFSLPFYTYTLVGVPEWI